MSHGGRQSTVNSRQRRSWQPAELTAQRSVPELASGPSTSASVDSGTADCRLSTVDFRGERGFSLLEVMVAIAIMALSLVVIVRITSMNVRAAAHARMITTATFLARSKLAAVEDDIISLGFTDSDEENAGDFSDEGQRNFRWESLVERVELPTDVAAQAQEAASDKTMEAQTGPSANPMAAMAGMMGGFMSTLIEPVRVGLQESVRRVTVKVMWDEVGRDEQSFEVVTYMTDPSKLDLAMGLPAAGATGAGGSGGSAGAGGAGGSAGGAPSARPAGTGSQAAGAGQGQGQGRPQGQRNP
ncbi:MAG TPA: prepilin-type N-terminal cleavage/methylation domain-containing protein [Polyangia bacterium]|nr:prepilin-type N-terminal cleavage/methylation domain-containing protein [Polyangia bacterium]